MSLYSLLVSFLLFLSGSQNVNNPTNLILTGDIMIGRGVMKQSLLMKNPSYPFLKVADKLKSADIVFSNLETPIVTNCPITGSGLKFCADPKMIEGLIFSGIDVVNLANNHILDYGTVGMNQTKEILTKNKIKWVDGKNLEILEKNKTKFGFLGFNFTNRDPDEIDYKLVKNSKSKVDQLIVMIHWGEEYSPGPNESQKNISDELIKKGADLVVGGHAHWVQPVDYIDNKPVFYSLGNFIFDQPWSEDTKHGLAVELSYTNFKLKSIKYLPIYMNNFAQPEWTSQ